MLPKKLQAQVTLLRRNERRLRWHTQNKARISINQLDQVMTTSPPYEENQRYTSENCHSYHIPVWTEVLLQKLNDRILKYNPCFYNKFALLRCILFSPYWFARAKIKQPVSQALMQLEPLHPNFVLQPCRRNVSLSEDPKCLHRTA